MASDWTVDTLRDHVEALLDAADKRYEQRFDAAENAVAKADAASEKRFDGVNEFRAALADQTASLIPRAEAETRLTVLNEKLSELGIEMRAAVGTLRESQTNSAGRDHGISQSWLVLLGAMGVAGVATDILTRLVK